VELPEVEGSCDELMCGVTRSRGCVTDAKEGWVERGVESGRGQSSFESGSG
jgi:hypothetical protein